MQTYPNWRSEFQLNWTAVRDGAFSLEGNAPRQSVKQFDLDQVELVYGYYNGADDLEAYELYGRLRNKFPFYLRVMTMTGFTASAHVDFYYGDLTSQSKRIADLVERNQDGHFALDLSQTTDQLGEPDESQLEQLLQSGIDTLAQRV